MTNPRTVDLQRVTREDLPERGRQGGMVLSEARVAAAQEETRVRAA
jgi:hypothetical protein